MNDELLDKIKGFSRTFIIHSNANPYAAAAAMGMMAGRSQEAGPYFQPSDTFIAMVEALAPEEPSPTFAPDPIEVNFISDWKAFLRVTGLPACKMTYKDTQSAEENTMRFLNAYNRRILPIRPRNIHESHEVSIPAGFQQDYENLIEQIRAGADLNPYLSRDISKISVPIETMVCLILGGYSTSISARKGLTNCSFAS